MGFPVGTSIPLQVTITDVTGAPVDPTSISLTVLRPDGGTDSFAQGALTHPSVGVFGYTYPTVMPGPYSWAFPVVGPGVVEQGRFVVDSLLTAPGPDLGVSPWIDADDVARWPGMAGVDRVLLTQAAQAASEALYAKSGRQWAGLKTTTLRPTMAAHERNIAAWAAFGGGYGTWGGGSWSPVGLGWAGSSFSGPRWLPAVDLGVYPLVSISLVTLDGVTIPANEYRIDLHKWLVRVRPSATSVPTERYGWPTFQRADLPATEMGTFAVTATYGMDPPAAGKFGAAALAADLVGQVLPTGGTNLPSRALSLTRQGVTVTLGDSLAYLEAGMFGVQPADAFVMAVNPSGATRRPVVWWPGMGDVR